MKKDNDLKNINVNEIDGIKNIYDGCKFCMKERGRLCNKAKELFKHHSVLCDISSAIQEYVESRGYSVVREFVGHGVGASLHESPEVPNFGKAGRGVRLLPGMTLAIEPMINIGKPGVKTLSDGWTVVTQDGSLSAHFEHSVAITKDGPIILTDADYCANK